MKYFVSTSGDNGNDGLTVDTAWLTIDYAVDHAPEGSAGNLNNIIIEAGIYRESVSFTPFIDYLCIQGDEAGEYFEQGGAVILDGTDAITKKITRTFGFNQYFRYCEIRNMTIQNFSSYAINDRNKYSDIYNVRTFNCGYIYKARNIYNCALFGGMYQCVDVYDSFTIYGYASNFYNSIIVATQSKYYPTALVGGSCHNCLIYGGERTITTSATQYNCIIMNAGYAVYNAGSFYNCKFIKCDQIFRLLPTGTVQGCTYTNCGTTNNPATGIVEGTGVSINRDIMKLLAGLKIDQMTKQDGYIYGSIPALDIAGLPRQMLGGSGYLDVGQRSLNNVEYDNTQVTINQIGVEKLDLPCKAGLETTLTCDIVSVDTTDRPELRIYDQDGVLVTSDSAIADSDSLTVTVTPESNMVYTVWLRATDSTAGASTTFSNIQINDVQGVINSQGEIYPVIARMDDVITEIKPTGSFFQIYIREQAAYTQPTNAAEWAAILATMTKLGAMELNQSQLLINPETIEQDTGNKKAVLYKAVFQARDLNYTPETVAEYTASWENQEVDILIYDSTQGYAIMVPEIIIHATEKANSGAVSYLELKAEKKGTTKENLRDIFNVPE